MRILAALLLLGATGFGQTTGEKTCAVDGVVVNSITGVPVPRAWVAVGTASAQSVVMGAESDAVGGWRVDKLPCGRAIIRVSRPGFLREARNTAAQLLTLSIENPLHDLRVELVPQSVLVGKVLDDQGDPIQGAQVSLMTSKVVNGLRGVQASTSTVTNDLGEYRFANLPAGKYILCANAGGGTVAANGSRPYSEKCFPAPLASGPSGAMSLATGYEGRVDFSLASLSTVNVSGVVTGLPEGGSALVNLVPRTQIARMSMGLSAPVNPDGTFIIHNVPSGSYVATAVFRRLIARAPLEAGSLDLSGLQLQLEPGALLTGTVKIVSSSAPKADKPRLSIMLQSTETAVAADPNSFAWDGNSVTFSVSDVTPGSYHIAFYPPPPFYLKSATLSGRDMASSDVPIGPGANNIEITIDDDGGSIQGDVIDADGSVPGWVLLMRDKGPSRNVPTDPKGHFRINTIPPGEYQIYAWDSNTNVEYESPDWMLHNGKPTAVTVQPNKSVDVKLTRQIAPAE